MARSLITIHSTPNILRFTILQFILGFAASSCSAFKPSNVTIGEIALLPPYCADTEAFNYGPNGSPRMSPRAPSWVAMMGPSFWAMHHYCWALVNLNRMQFGRLEVGVDKKLYAKYLVEEYMYVIRNASPDFILLPEVWVRIGEASILSGAIVDAKEAYSMARKIKPDYVPAYSQWAEFLFKSGKYEEAKQLVQEGLGKVRNSKRLQMLFMKLGGDLSKLPSSQPASVPSPSASSSVVASSAP